MGTDSATMGDEAEEAGNLTGAGQRPTFRERIRRLKSSASIH